MSLAVLQNCLLHNEAVDVSVGSDRRPAQLSWGGGGGGGHDSHREERLKWRSVPPVWWGLLSIRVSGISSSYYIVHVLKQP